MNSVGKILEIGLNNGKDISNFGNDEITVALKLSKDELKDKNTANLKAYVYDKEKKEWKAVDGEFDNNAMTYTFKTNKTGMFTVAEEKKDDSSNVNDGNTVKPGDNIKPGDNVANGSDNSTDNNTGNNTSKNTGKNTSKISRVKTGDSVVFAATLAVTAAVAGAAAFITGRKKDRD